MVNIQDKILAFVNVKRLQLLQFVSFLQRNYNIQSNPDSEEDFYFMASDAAVAK